MFLPSLIREGGGPIEQFLFRRGDASNDGAVNLTDAVNLLGHLFQAQPAPACPDAADFNDDGLLNLTDAVFLLNHLFAAGEPLPPPGISGCGEDLTDDSLTDCSTDECLP